MHKCEDFDSKEGISSIEEKFSSTLGDSKKPKIIIDSFIGSRRAGSSSRSDFLGGERRVVGLGGINYQNSLARDWHGAV